MRRGILRARPTWAAASRRGLKSSSLRHLAAAPALEEPRQPPCTELTSVGRAEFSSDELRRRQEELETRVHDEAVARYREMAALVTQHGRAASIAQQLLVSWFTPLETALKKEQEDITNREKGIDRSIYGPYLMGIEPAKLAVITIHEFLNLALVESKGIKVVRVASAIGRAVEAERWRPKHTLPQGRM